MFEMFRLGGVFTIPTFLFGALTLVAAMRYAVRPARPQLPLILSLGVLTLCSGSLGFVAGLIKSFEAVGQVPAEDRWIWLLGTSESLHNLMIAFAMLTLAAAAACFGAYRSTRNADPATV